MTDKHGRNIPPNDDRKDKPMRRFAEATDREQLAQFLEQSGNDRYHDLFSMMYDPAYAALSFPSLCKKAGVTLHEMQTLYTDGMRQLALLHMSNALPDLMADVAEDAKTRMENCPRCDGYGFITVKNKPEDEPTTRDCPTCEARGKVRRIGDKQSRDLIFEAAKLTKQSGPMIAIQQNFATGDSHMEAILKKTRAITLDKPIVTGENTGDDEPKPTG